MIQPKTLAGLNPREYEHPYDAKALDALQATPGLARFVRAYNKHYRERAVTVELTGSYLRVNADAYSPLACMTCKGLWNRCRATHQPSRNKPCGLREPTIRPPA